MTCCKVHIDPLELNDIGAACRAPGEKVPSACPADRRRFRSRAAFDTCLLHPEDTESNTRLFFQGSCEVFMKK